MLCSCAGADVNSEAKDGATALYEACRNNHSDIVELLLSQSADANRAGKDKLLPLHVAAKHGNNRCVQRLFFEWSDWSFYFFRSFYLLTVCWITFYILILRIISKLIPITSLTEIQRSGISPVHLSAESDEDHTLELLIHAGFDVNFLLAPERSCMYEDRRLSPLYFAVDNRNLEAASMLLEAGADPNLDPFNALLLAVRQGDIHMATLLLEHGANVNAPLPTHPSTFPACVMLSVRNITMMKCLMDHGCEAEACFRCEHRAEEPPMFSETHPCLQVSVTLRNNETSKQSFGDYIFFFFSFCTHSSVRWSRLIQCVTAQDLSLTCSWITSLLWNYVPHSTNCWIVKNPGRTSKTNHVCMPESNVPFALGETLWGRKVAL